MRVGDRVTDAMRELLQALDAVDAGMPVESSDTAGRWFARAEARVTKARVRCAEILNARHAKDGES